jgi:putative FmdB family regulatory protein
MPVYTYRCGECGSEFERQQSFNEPPLKKCPVCGKEALQKVFTPVGIVFKGSGFYSTDHRSTSSRSDAKADSKNGKAATKSGPAADAKPESKPTPPAPAKDE